MWPRWSKKPSRSVKGGVWNMFEYVVMPNHIHLFFELVGEGLKKHLEQFKRWTGTRGGQVARTGTTGRFWQDEWFDHWLCSDEEDEKIIKYIRENPVKANLVK